MDIKKQKTKVRKEIRLIKSSISTSIKKELSITILDNLENDNDFKNSQIILSYWSMKDEVHTHNFNEKWKDKKSIYLPVVVGNDLEFRLFTGKGSMVKDAKFGIWEPKGEPLEDYSRIDYAIIPGVAFDRYKNRLGRGRAFYDRILNNISAPKVGVCFEFQILDIIPTESTDIKMDRIICTTTIN